MASRGGPRALPPVGTAPSGCHEAPVPVHVHLVAHNSRLGAIGVVPDDLVDMWASDADVHRVIELRDPGPGIHVADLCMSERELPEVLSLLQDCERVHLHGVSPRIGLCMLPCIKPEALERTTLVVHGPWPRVTATVTEDATRLGSWPGPVVFDELARRSHRDDVEAGTPVDAVTAAKADPAEDQLARLHVDLHAASLLPREVGPRPHDTPPGEPPLVAITLAAEFRAGVRDAILAALDELDTDGLHVELWDERGMDPAQRSATRRHAQACIAPVHFHWSSSRVVLEAAAQRVPVLAVGEALEQVPPGVIHLEDPAQLGEALGAWLAAWRQARAAPVEVDAARDWLVSQAVS